MKKIRIWFSEWGNRFFRTDLEKRTNRFINNAFLSVVLFATFLLAIQALIKHYGLSQGLFASEPIGSVFTHLLPAHLALIGTLIVMLVIKNTLGRSALANGLSFFACLNFCLYLGLVYSGGAQVHLLVVAFMLFPLALWNMQKRWLSYIELSAGLACLVFVIWYSSAFRPLVQIPPLLEPALVSANLLYLVFSCLAFAYYFVKAGARSERQFLFESKLRQQLLTSMIPELQRSEKRYSHLVEDAVDIVFSLNEQFEFKIINRTVKKILYHDPASLIGKKISSIIVSHGEDDLDRQLLEENLQAVLKNKETRDFRIGFKGKHNVEPVNMRLALSYSESEGECEILGKASLLTEDKLNEFLESERSTYVIDNSLLNAEDLSRQLTRHLHKRLTAADLTTLRVALREMLVNAIEHGNLNVTFEEKTQAQLEGRYLEFLRERMQNAVYACRRVRVEYVLRANFVGFRITDEGSGFDHRIFVEEAEGGGVEEGLEHGRGIKMSRNAFDRVQYMNPGNKVILIKKFIS